MSINGQKSLVVGRYRISGVNDHQASRGYRFPQRAGSWIKKFQNTVKAEGRS